MKYFASHVIFTCSMEDINLIQTKQPDWAAEIDVRKRMGLDPFRGEISLSSVEAVENFYL